jgi:hypothetical protein
MCILLKQHTHYQLKMQCKIHQKIAQVVFPLLFKGVLLSYDGMTTVTDTVIAISDFGLRIAELRARMPNPKRNTGISSCNGLFRMIRVDNLRSFSPRRFTLLDKNRKLSQHSSLLEKRIQILKVPVSGLLRRALPPSAQLGRSTTFVLSNIQFGQEPLDKPSTLKVKIAS